MQLAGHFESAGNSLQTASLSGVEQVSSVPLCSSQGSSSSWSSGHQAGCDIGDVTSCHAAAAAAAVHAALQFGQLGLGHHDDEAAPVVVEALAGHPVTLLACGWRHTVAVCTSGEVRHASGLTPCRGRSMSAGWSDAFMSEMQASS
jgi:hypothetical protein